MKKKIVIALLVVTMTVAHILEGCGVKESAGNAESTELIESESKESESQIPKETVVADDLAETTPEIEDYFSEAQEQRDLLNFESADRLYQNAYEANGDQQALIEVLNMWLSEKNDKEVKKWVDYAKTNCAEMNDELLALVEKGENIQWMITNITDLTGSSEIFWEYDEYGRIVRCNMPLHRGLIRITDECFYEYLEDGRVKVTETDVEAEEQRKQYAGMTEEDLLEAGIVPDFLNTWYYIYTYDEEGRIITKEEYRNDTFRGKWEFYYNMTYDIALGQGGLKTNAEIEKKWYGANGSSTTDRDSGWYYGYKIGVFGILNASDSNCDEYGNIVQYNDYTLEYIYCTPEEYFNGK